MEWRKIKTRPNYSVSDDGEIRNDKTGRLLKLHLGTSGYYQVMLGRKTAPLYVHRIVAEAFIENVDNKPQVDHINGIKTDNKVSNLRWVTVRENVYGFGHDQRITNKKRKVLAKNDNQTLIFASRKECAEYFGIDTTKIKYNRVYQGEKCKGWTFQKVEDIV